MEPCVGSIKRFTKRINVDLPLPDSPMMTKNSPFSTENVALFTATVHPVFSSTSALEAPSSTSFCACLTFLPNIFVRPCTSITGTYVHLIIYLTQKQNHEK